MTAKQSAATLLKQARELYDTSPTLSGAAPAAAKQAFASGAQWMKEALELIRRQRIGTPDTSRFNRLGFIKYGLACAFAIPFVLAAWYWRQPAWLLVCVPAFYAIEAQMVFLFPLCLDGCDRPFREAREWTVRAGGTLTVMATVLPLAATMLFGGFVGSGFVRSWCLGCLAVCLWYEHLRLAR